MPLPPSQLVLIAGGSGSGKTTLALALAARFPNWTLVHLDDYQKRRADVPRLGRHSNWDHPDAVDFPALIRDLEALRRGDAITIMARTSQTARATGRVRRTIVPGPTVLVEGYLALWHPDVRELADYSIYIDAPWEARKTRRRWNMDEDYLNEVLEPMHRLHVEPTRRYADLVLDAGAMTPERMLEEAAACVGPHH